MKFHIRRLKISAFILSFLMLISLSSCALWLNEYFGFTNPYSQNKKNDEPKKEKTEDPKQEEPNDTFGPEYTTIFDAKDYEEYVACWYSDSAPDFVTIEGKIYMKFIINGYQTWFSLKNPIDCSNFTEFHVECKAEEEYPETQVIIGIKDSMSNDISLLYMYPNSSDTVVVSVDSEDFFMPSSTKIAAIIQPMAQTCNDYLDFSGKDGIVFYISKIVAK